MTWKSVADFAPMVPQLDLEPLRRPEEMPDDRTIKDSTTRSVFRIDDPVAPGGPGLYVKRYKFRDLFDRLRYTLAPSKPAREWRICRALQAADIPTCDVLAIAVRRRRGLPCEGFLVSREITGTVHLKEFARQQWPARPRKFRRELAAELASLTAELAEGGFHHTDYHAENLLVRPEAPPGSRLVVTDLHAMRRRRVRRRHMVKMLAMLHGSVPEQVGLRARVRYLRAFLQRWGGDSRGRSTAWARAVAEAATAHERRHLRSRTKRCLKESSLFTRAKTSDFVVHRRRDFPLGAALSAVDTHREALSGRAPQVEVCRAGRRTEVSLCTCESVPPRTLNQPADPEDVLPGTVCVKAFRRDTLPERLKDVLRPRSRARGAWFAARGFHVRGLPAAQPLALLESRHKLRGDPDYLITEELPNEGGLVDFIRSHEPDATERRRLGRAVADLLLSLDRQEVYHPDTKPTNILVHRGEDGLELYLIDLERVRFGRPMSRKEWTKCLARINAQLPQSVSLLERVRCLRRCARGRWDAGERREIAQRVHQLSLQRGGPSPASNTPASQDT
ncbi:MAG: lipopolysaccharide kinase InaA family protein [Candidatus Brocadiia bacterium]